MKKWAIFVQAMNVFLKLFRESVIIAFQEILGNRLRAFLSLLGVTIGIFCIISVFTAIDSLEMNIRGSLGKLGDNVLYVQKFPWNEDPKNSWWKYNSRPITKYEEYKQLHDHLKNAAGVTVMFFQGGKTLKNADNSVENATLVSVTYDYDKVRNMDIVDGRYFTFGEALRGSRVAIIGADIAEQLFPRVPSPVGKTFKVLGNNVTVIGVMRKEGEDLLGWTADNQVILPYNFTKTLVDLKSNKMEPIIAVKAKNGVSTETITQEIRGIMRAARSLRPTQEDNFAVNQLSLISGVLDTIFGVIGFAGFMIGIFSILVGGFGIANIMFVSVKERTNIIGIKKALGARSIFILIEFLTEAVVLCLIGGVVGLLAVLLETYVLGVVMKQYYTMDFEFVLTLKNVVKGLSISIISGIISGFIPAYLASRMRPVDAIRSK